MGSVQAERLTWHVFARVPCLVLLRRIQPWASLPNPFFATDSLLIYQKLFQYQYSR